MTKHRLFRTFGHLCGIGGAFVGANTVARIVPLGLVRIFPAASLLGHARVTGPLSLWLIGLGFLLVRFGQGR